MKSLRLRQSRRVDYPPWTLFWILTVLPILWAVPASAQLCEEPGVQAELQYLKRLSLDLRGTLPSYEEYATVVDTGEVSDMVIESMLFSDGFSHQMRQYHRDLLWTNIENQRFANNNFFLALPRGRQAAPVYSSISFAKRTAYRGAQVGCLDQPAEFDDNGNIITYEQEFPEGSGQFVRQEGWVEVEPYWAPGTTIKVCAFDAQTSETGTSPQGQPINCNSRISSDCGCGPNLNWCFTQESQQVISQAMTDQMLKFVDLIIDEDRPYTDILQSGRYPINGPLTHYYRYLTMTGPNFVAALPDPGYALPDISFTELEWTEVEAHTPLHSGLLTLPGFLLKFQSNRGRANRFYEAFLCESFQAPEGGLPAADDECNQEPDLTKRCGCLYCHQAVEPAAAHWGRWTEAGLAPMEDDTFPAYNPQCDPNSSRNAQRNFFCRRFYNTDPESPWAGYLVSYEFSGDHPGRTEILETGPSKIAGAGISTGGFGRCVTEKIWTLFMNRPFGSEEEALEATLLEGFTHNYSMRDLIRSIVTGPEYRYAGLMGEEE